jgi:hypothetical protein
MGSKRKQSKVSKAQAAATAAARATTGGKQLPKLTKNGVPFKKKKFKPGSESLP